MKVCQFILIYLISFSVFTQKQDYNWLLGYNPGKSKDTNVSISILNFKDEFLNIRKDSTLVRFNQTNSIISNNVGDKILIASNGFQVYDASLKKILPDFRINIGAIQWSESSGMFLRQAILILPNPGSQSQYSLFYLWEGVPKPDSFVQTNKLYQATVDINGNLGLGELINKDQLIMSAPFEYGKITACQHANGRDWWIIIPRRYSKEVYIFLFDPNGISLHRTQIFSTITHTGIGMAVFSPDGKQYSIANTDGNDPDCKGYVEVYNFDRCNGILSNKREMFTLDYSCMRGLAFAPDNRFLFYNTESVLYRLDITIPELKDSKIIIDSIDGTADPFLCYFGGSLLAPDGRVYLVSDGSSNRCLSRINYPDELDPLKIEFDQNGIRLPSYNFKTIPNLPNFRLGPVDGSICDSLGIDNIPLARFRYDQNMMDHLYFRFTDLSSFEPEQWSWDFGDPNSINNTSTQRNPNHQFSSEGVFQVCLTVNNVNGKDTQCKTLNIGLTDNKDEGILFDKIELFPNPVNDVLIIQIGNYIPSSMKFILSDLLGKNINTQKLNSGLNSIDCSDLNSGYYLYKIFEKNRQVKMGSFIVIK